MIHSKPGNVKKIIACYVRQVKAVIVDHQVTYGISCEGECPFKYHGQTSSNAYTRGVKHIEDLEKKREKPLWKHCVNEHNGEKRNFEMKIITQCRNDATKRQIIEAIWIRNTDSKITIERSEWNDVRIPRIEINN